SCLCYLPVLCKYGLTMTVFPALLSRYQEAVTLVSLLNFLHGFTGNGELINQLPVLLTGVV
ncbi:hypothetical protein, partial [Morganella morganii]|uniref:hypothetical protein n=1 Tax=Morganella morganii TaxID=582 RepID=UPI00197C7E23